MIIKQVSPSCRKWCHIGPISSHLDCHMVTTKVTTSLPFFQFCRSFTGPNSWHKNRVSSSESVQSKIKYFSFLPFFLFSVELKLNSPLQNDKSCGSHNEIANSSDLKGKQERKTGIKKQRRPLRVCCHQKERRKRDSGIKERVEMSKGWRPLLPNLQLRSNRQTPWG